jgi:hypothetical protein
MHDIEKHSVTLGAFSSLRVIETRSISWDRNQLRNQKEEYSRTSMQGRKRGSNLQKKKMVASLPIERVILSAGAMLIFSVSFQLTICP